MHPALAVAPGAAVAAAAARATAHNTTNLSRHPPGNSARTKTVGLLSSPRLACRAAPARRAATVTVTAAFPAGTPDATGIVPGVGKGMPKWPEVWLARLGECSWLQSHRTIADSATATRGGRRTKRVCTGTL
jgi:hypothetical protein